MKRSILPALVILSLTSCAKVKGGTPMPVMQNMVQTHSQRTTKGTDGQPKVVDQVVSKVTLLKSALLGRTFLYGSTLQTSSIQDGTIAVTMMGLAIGELPAQFAILDNKLRLMTDPRLNFESDINTPARLILEFTILSQDDNTVTIQADKASPILDTFIFDNKGSVLRPRKQASFIRSMQYVEENELFLIESTVELADGSVAEVMEHLLPRERIVPKDAPVVYADKDLNPDADRYRFLSGPKFYADVPGKGRIQTTTAQRWLMKDDQPIKWWVTRNAPDQYLGDIKNGVEGWNRYSQAANGKNIIQFMGKLPEGIKLGDIRYNVIAWDGVAMAGAAYESQNADPFTGVQVNSLIYLPNAWVNIGKEYWDAAANTQAKSAQRFAQLTHFTAHHGFVGSKLPLNCLEDPMMHVTLASKDSPEIFGRKLLRDTLFHEVGHSFGLAHNFKGSLAFDDDKKNGAFSTSIMDYNYYNEELAAFDSLDGSTGPLLEYDRQIISVLYNGKKDVKDSDPVLPACADDEADSFQGGVDPLCIRYDIGSDPTQEALRTYSLLTDPNAQAGGMASLPVTIQNLITTLPPAASLNSTDDLKKAVALFATNLSSEANLYLGGSANSLANIGGASMKSMYVAQKGILPAGYNENEMRGRAYSLLETVMNTTEFPAATKGALASARTQLEAYIRSAPVVTSLAGNDQEKTITDILTTVDSADQKTEQSLLAKSRVKILGALKYNSDGPLGFVQTASSGTIDMESEVVKALEASAGPKVGNADRLPGERLAAIQNLVTFAKVPAGQAALKRLDTELNAEITASQDALKRETLRKLLAALTTPPAPAASN